MSTEILSPTTTAASNNVESIKFVSLAEATKAYLDLEKDSQQLLDEALTANKEFQEQATAKDTEIEALKSELNDAKMDIAALEKAAKDTEATKADQKELAAREAARIAAESGVEPANVDEEPNAAANELTREQFEAIPLAERPQFFKDGGKLIAG